MKRRCDRCVAWKTTTNHYDGLCKMQSPQAGLWQGYWPITRFDDWCMEFVAKEEDECKPTDSE